MRDLQGVAYCGKQGSGKTTLAETTQSLLDEEHGKDGEIVPLAAALKDAVNETLNGLYHGGVIPESTHLELTKEQKRPAFQAIGAELRNHWPDVWAETWRHKCEQLLAEDVLPLNDDMRYPNEVETAQDLGIVVVRLQASRELRGDRISIVGEEHESETALDDYSTANYDIVIDQDEGEAHYTATGPNPGGSERTVTLPDIEPVTIARTVLDIATNQLDRSVYVDAT